MVATSLRRMNSHLAHRRLPCTCLLLGALLSACRPQLPTTAPASAPASAAVPKRIIAIAPNAAEIIAALGETKRLVGVGDFCKWPPELAALPRVGGLFDTNLEAVLRLQPDLLIMRGRNDALERLCADRGIRVYHDPTETFDDIYGTLHELGDLLDRRAAADAIERDMRRRLERITAAVAGRPRPRVFITLARNPDSPANILTATKRTFIHEVIALAGGENVFADLAMDYPQVSPEAVLAAKPDVIIEAMPEAQPTPELTQTVRALWRKLGPIPAVENDRVYLLTEENALVPSPRIVDIVARVARWLHPDANID